MLFKSEQALAEFAKSFGLFLRDNLDNKKYLSLCIELVGDVGAGKTTFTRYLAEGLGIKSPVTSPSFTISKHYSVTSKSNDSSAGGTCDTHPGTTSVNKNRDFELIHYDFYRLDDPGLMAEDLEESLDNPSAIVILEWANSVKNVLPKDHYQITFKVLPDGSRDLTFNQPMQTLISEKEGGK